MAFKRFGSSKTPEPFEVHVAEVAEPPIEPFRVISLSEQIDASGPAATSTVSFKVISIWSDTDIQGPAPSGSSTTIIKDTDPAAFSILDGI